MRSALTFDWRDAVRSLRATPVITVIALLSLGLGIGANTALFSILNSLALTPLPVRDPEQLIHLTKGSWTNPIWEQIRDRQSQLFDGAFAWSNERFNLSSHGETDFVDGAYASGRIFDVLGIRAYRGRTLSEADDRRDGGASGPVVVISYSLWQGRFNGAEDVLGRSVTIEGKLFQIVGITPPGFFGPDVGRSCDLYVPLANEALIRGRESYLDGRSTWWLEIMAREKLGQSLAQADAALHGVQPQIREATRPEPPFPADYLSEPLTFEAAATGRSPLRSRYLAPLTILMVVVGAVLLVACANIANLLLARATARRHELVVRLALGASRARLARQLFLESLLLAGGGAFLGLGLARMGSTLLVHQLSTATATVSLSTSPDWRVLAFTGGVALVTAVLFGLAPALGVTRATPNEALKEQSRTVSGDRRLGLRNVLVIGQVALSLMLVVAAGLFLRTFTSLTAVPLGFNPEPLLVVSVNVLRSAPQPQERLALFERLRNAVASVPGVKSAALSRIRPLSGQGWNNVVEVPGSPLTDRQRMTWINGVSPGWFSTYDMRLLEGRDFSDLDRPGGELVAIVNETFARKFLGSREGVVGRNVRRGAFGRFVTFKVIGVVADAVYRTPREGEAPTMFVPLAQVDRLDPTLTLAVEARPGARGSIERSVSAALAAVDGRVAFTFGWFSDLARIPMAQERLVAMLAGFFGALALLLAGLGLYGLTSYSVNRRRREIGVRMALGADPLGVVRLVLSRVTWLVAAGIVVGGALSWWVGKYVAATLLFRLEARDPGTFGTAALILVCVGAIAGWLPARRASRIDPTKVLREE
jgi:predicted permease